MKKIIAKHPSGARPNDLVEYYEYDSDTVVKMPAASVNKREMVRAEFEGRIVWIAIDKLRFVTSKLMVLDNDIHVILAFIRDLLHEVKPLSLNEWENTGHNILSPLHEILEWLRVADVYRQLTDDVELSLDAKKRCFQDLLFAAAVGSNFFLLFSIETRDGCVEAKAIVDAYLSSPNDSIWGCACSAAQ
jgi:hypothetical protein